MDLQEYVNIGRVGKAQGIRGETRVIVYAGMPDDLTDCSNLILQGRDGGCVPMQLEKVRNQAKHLIVKFTGVESRDDAESLCGLEIWIHEGNIPQLEDDHYYWYEFEGLEVVTESDVLLGRVEGVFATGANDVLVVKGKGQEYLIPVIDEVLLEVSLQKGRITIAPLPGLLDMNV